MESKLKFLLIARKWKWLPISFFPLPFIILSLAFLVPFDFPQESVVDLFYLCWAIGIGLLNFTKQKEEDEMIEQLRTKSFFMGVYYLIWGVAVISIYQFIRFGSLYTDIMSAYLSIFLLNTYIFISFQYYKWQNR